MVLASITLGSATARAQAQTPAPDPWLTPHPSGAPPQGAPRAAPAPVQPLPYGEPSPSPYMGQPYGFNQRSVFMYENDKKNPGVALLINFLFMGAGSIYADHAAGALIAWGVMIGGVALVIWAVNPDRSERETEYGVTGGLMMMAGAVIYSYVDAYQSAKEYNRNLARRLGLPIDLALSATSIRNGETTAWGPALTLRF